MRGVRLILMISAEHDKLIVKFRELAERYKSMQKAAAEFKAQNEELQRQVQTLKAGQGEWALVGLCVGRGWLD
jgi:uncharacterized coiled-coil DUF342 family protein